MKETGSREIGEWKQTKGFNEMTGSGGGQRERERKKIKR